MITAKDLKSIAPQAKASLLPPLAKAMNVLLPAAEIDRPLRIVHFLAQAAHESAGFKTLVEYWGPTKAQKGYEGRKDLGNTQPGDGKRYMGRGIFQLTGRANYRRIGNLLNLPLEEHPELAADPYNSVRIACEYWKQRKINPMADRDDVKAVSIAINGKNKRTGLPNGLEDRKKYLARAKSVMKFEEDEPDILTLGGINDAEVEIDHEPLSPVTAGVPTVSPQADTDPPITPQSPAGLIEELQRELKAKNYYDGSIDGKWVDFGLTDIAVMAAKKRLGLSMDEDVMRLSEARQVPPFVITSREDAGITEIRKTDTPSGEQVRFWDRVQAWGTRALIAIGIPVGGSAIDQAESGVGFVSRVKNIFEPFGGLSWLVTGYTPWLVVIGGLVTFIVVGQVRKNKAKENYVEGKTS